MSFLSNITTGGQLQIHQLRMFKQILIFAFSISIFISLIFGAYNYKQKIQSDDQTLAIEYLAAKFLTRIPISNKNEIKQEIKLGKKTTEVKSTYILTKTANIQAYGRVINIIKNSFKQTIILFISVYMIIFVIWASYGKKQKDTDIIKGRNFISPQELARHFKKINQVSDIIITSDLSLPKNSETRHILTCGTTGAGKSNLFNIIIPQIRRRRNKAIVIDVTGQYLAKYYNTETDYIFNPFDMRTVRWNLWDDCYMKSHYEALSNSIIPEKNNQDDIWDIASRLVLVEVMKKMAKENNNNLKDFLKIICNTNLVELESYLKGTKAAQIINHNSEKTSFSVLMNLSAHILSLEILSNVDKKKESFSIRRWIENDENKDSWIFVSSRQDQIDATKPLISAFTDIALNQLLSIEPDELRRIWFIIDELPALNKLPALPSALVQSRKYGGCIFAGIQNTAQLEDIYGLKQAQSILDMFNSFFFFRCQNPQTTKWISDMMGIVEQKELNEQMSYGANTFRDGVSFSKQLKQKQLIMPIEIANLSNLEAYIKFASHDITKIQMKYQEIANIHPGFMIGEV